MTRDFDDRLVDFLADEGRRATLAAPSLEEAVGRLAPRLAPRTARSPRRLLILLAAALLMAAALGSAIAIGSGWLRLPLVIDTPSIPPSGEPVFEVALHYYIQGGNVARVPEPTLIHARLPDGWVSTGSGITNDPDEPERPIAVSFWTVDAVLIDPCNAQDSVGGADPPMMRSLDGLVDAFTLWWSADTRDEWWGGNPPPDLPSTTSPIDTTVSGFRARYLEVRIPDTVDVDRCQGGRYATWRNADGVERRHRPGDVSRIWIVEVGRPRNTSQPSTPLLVIDATSVGEASPEALRDLEQVIGSIRIENAETRVESRIADYVRTWGGEERQYRVILTLDLCENLGRLGRAQREKLEEHDAEGPASPEWRQANGYLSAILERTDEMKCPENVR